MCCKPHHESGPTGKALVEAEVTWQDTEHNTVDPYRNRAGFFGTSCAVHYNKWYRRYMQHKKLTWSW